jgi:hypothetical protein
VDLGDDLGVDHGRWTPAVVGRAAPGGTDRRIPDRSLVDPLLDLAGLDLLPLELGRALGATWATRLANLGGATLGFVGRLGATAVLLTTLSDRATTLRRTATASTASARAAAPGTGFPTRSATGARTGFAPRPTPGASTGPPARRALAGRATRARATRAILRHGHQCYGGARSDPLGHRAT